MVDRDLLTELRQLYDLQLQAGRQCEWGVKKELSILCMTILDQIVDGGLHSLYRPLQPETSSPLPQESPVAVPCE